MAIYRHRILYEKGVIPRIAKRFSVSDNTVRYALRFVTEGEQPDLIRIKAIRDYNGVLIKRKPKFNLKTL